MASISELLVGSALEGAQKAPDYAGNFAQGAQLAQNLEKLKLQRMELEQQKQNVRNQSLEAMSKDVLKARELGGKALSGFRDFLKNKAKVTRTDDIFTPESIDLITSVPENVDRFDVILNKVTSGQMDYATAAETLKDEGLFYEVDPADRQRLAEAAKTAILEGNKMDRTEKVAQAAMTRQTQGQEAAPKVDIEKKVRDDHRKFMTEGGLAKAESRIQKLKEAEAFFKEQMEQGKKPTGTLGAAGAQRLGLQGLRNPKLKANMDKLRNSIALKGSLDSQFSAKEAEQQYAQQTADADLPVENAYERAKAIREEAEAALKNASGTFRQYGLSLDANESVKSVPKTPKGKAPKAPKGPRLETLKIRGKDISASALIEAAKGNPNLLNEVATELDTTLEQLKEDLGIE